MTDTVAHKQTMMIKLSYTTVTDRAVVRVCFLINVTGDAEIQHRLSAAGIGYQFWLWSIIFAVFFRGLNPSIATSDTKETEHTAAAES